MLKPKEMRRFRAVVSQDLRDKVLAALHEAGVVQFKEITEEIERGEVEEELYKIDSVLGRIREIQEFFATVRFRESAEVEGESPEEVLESTKELLGELEEAYTELSSRKEELEDRKENIQTQKDILQYLKEIEIPLDYLRSTKGIHVTVGRIDEDVVDDFVKSAQNTLSQRVFVTISERGEIRTVVVACLKEDVPDFQPLLYKFDVETLRLPPLKGTPDEAIDELEERLADLSEREEQLADEIDEVAQDKSLEINSSVELLEIVKERLECLSLFGRTNMTLVLEGWVLPEKIPALREALEEASDDVYLMRIYEPEVREMKEVPVSLENPKVVGDFEYITNMYGLPKYKEVDPTWMLAISFPLFFGFCLTDAGYGLLVAALFLAAPGPISNLFSRKLRRMLIVCALTTFVVGFVFGGWFGDLFANIHPIFGSHWIRPLDEPISFLKLVVFVGILQIVVGYGIGRSLTDAFRRNWKRIIFNDLGKALLTVGLFGLTFCVLHLGLSDFGIEYVFPKVDILEVFNPFTSNPLIVTIFQGVFYLGLVLAIAGNILTGEGFVGKVGGVVNPIYGVIRLIADAASYTRLMALGISTAVIAFVVNEIGFLFYHMISPATFTGPLSYLLGAVGVIVLVIILVFGHAFNIFINSITGFIHTMRLEFAEFFEKFYEGGGKKFTTFKVKRTFTKGVGE
ncbi:hypothetical protein AKJ47_02275 [candidate division MSBL1 archaeon SCGC-AAA261G05]|uniref:A-type ATP synthase subunit I n=2 Tax=candidate division MSBL1 TaxID=215777 RepID=A0A133VAE8_9EURY|nr:hypothetical protein AKJ47_02275 [candidate division MSBL1 archaeon SCGC-AAA261G05]KXB04570.1 hypothetical protein AKJ48_02085 [candidate division MSBL1 archaeon SCGC-AAA261O19]